MNDTKYDRHLHLIRIREDEAVVRSMPIRIKSERMDATGLLRDDETCGVRRPFPARRPDVKRLGENIVIHEASVDREQAHENDDVATAGNKSTRVSGS